MGIRVISGMVTHTYNGKEYSIDFDSQYLPDIPDDIDDYRLKELLELYRLNAKAKISFNVLSERDKIRYSELKELYCGIYKENLEYKDLD